MKRRVGRGGTRGGRRRLGGERMGKSGKEWGAVVGEREGWGGRVRGGRVRGWVEPGSKATHARRLRARATLCDGVNRDRKEDDGSGDAAEEILQGFRSK